ncbi:MAG: type III secretion system chaperone [Duodenibacillus sp.]|nr:type III secretion system chaperone [Duodenibacillus sp.]
MLREQFLQILKEFSDLNGQHLEPDEQTDTVSFFVDEEVLINLRYLDESDNVLIFSPVGGFGPLTQPDAGAKAIALLKLTDIGAACGDITLALDGNAQLVLAIDRRSALTISSVDALSAWIEIIVRAVRTAREHFAENFPVQGDE